MKSFFGILIIAVSVFSEAAVEKTGQVQSVQIWGSIVKSTVCSSDNSCESFWVSLDADRGSAVMSLWLAAKITQNSVYIQGQNPDPSKSGHPYGGASEFYGMNLR